MPKLFCNDRRYKSEQTPTRGKRVLTRHLRNEDGSTTIFGLFTFVIVLMLTGVGVDVLRHETLRSELQSTLDRAVLAAANLDNQNDPEEVVRDYFHKAGLYEYLTSVTAVSNDGGRSVTAQVDAKIPTYFMRLAALDELSLSGDGTAEQGVSSLEISLVLDVSGSMGDNNRLPLLKNAATGFNDTVFANSTPELTSVNVVPYSAQVNVPPELFNQVSAESTATDNARCYNFTDSEFNSASVSFGPDGNAGHQPSALIDPWNWQYNSPYFNTPVDNPVCNYTSSGEVLALSNNQSEINAKINGLQLDGATSIDIGAKWGAALLHEDFSNAVPALISANEASSAMSARPLASGGESLKVMVIMSDGQNTPQYVLKDSFRDGLSDVYLAPNGKISFPAQVQVCQWHYWWKNCYTQTRYYQPRTTSTGGYYTQPYGGSSAVLMTWKELFSRVATQQHARMRYAATGNSSDYYSWRDGVIDQIGSSQKNDRLADICRAAKDYGILVFTIGFEVPESSQQHMTNCASSPSHFYDVAGLEINDAFAAIAAKVTELRVVE